MLNNVNYQKIGKEIIFPLKYEKKKKGNTIEGTNKPLLIITLYVNRLNFESTFN